MPSVIHSEILYYRLLAAVRAAPAGEPRRLLHGRGGTVSGAEALTVDLYPPLLYVVLYDDLPREELNSLQGLCSLLINRLREEGRKVEGAVIQRRGGGFARTVGIIGNVPERTSVHEAGLSYRIEPLRGQNPGLFLDMRPGRDLVRRIAAGRRVLNLFAYTCAFSVAAAAGGAVEVVNLDMKSSVLDRGRENHRLNAGLVEGCRVEYLALNLMKSFSRIDRLAPFDLVILDPPSRQGRSFDYRGDYAKILRRMRPWLAPEGVLLSCLNAPDAPSGWLEETVREILPELHPEGVLLKGDDFPEAEEGRELIGRVWRFPSAPHT